MEFEELKRVRTLLCYRRITSFGIWYDLRSTTHRLLIWLIFACYLLQLEKAEILEKTIIYIKKLQEITGKQDLDSEKRNDYNLNNQGDLIMNEIVIIVYPDKWIEEMIEKNGRSSLMSSLIHQGMAIFSGISRVTPTFYFIFLLRTVSSWTS